MGSPEFKILHCRHNVPTNFKANKYINILNIMSHYQQLLIVVTMTNNMYNTI